MLLSMIQHRILVIAELFRCLMFCVSFFTKTDQLWTHKKRVDIRVVSVANGNHNNIISTIFLLQVQKPRFTFNMIVLVFASKAPKDFNTYIIFSCIYHVLARYFCYIYICMYVDMTYDIHVICFGLCLNIMIYF